MRRYYRDTDGRYVAEYKVTGWPAGLVWIGLILTVSVPWFIGFFMICRWIVEVIW